MESKNQAKGFAMALDQHYIPAFSIEEIILDKNTGAPLDGGKVYFMQDKQRNIPKPVYQITGAYPNYTYVPLTDNPLILSSIGTFQDALGNPIVPYFFPYDGNFDPEYYFVKVTSSGDVDQFTREAVPYLTTQEDQEISSLIVNEISNPQSCTVGIRSS
ncbi:hypothetical protein [Fluoribacter gormanii]|nr:hypothetical protein [Fluoribacter gormanii]